MFDFLFLLLGLTSAQAQTCPTRPTGDNSNACASTAFVKNQNYLPNIGWTNGLPLIGSPTGTVTQGTISGTTTKFPVVDGTTTGGQCAVWDSNGGLTSVNCSPPGSGTVGSGTVGQLAIYTDSTAVAGTSTGVITVANIAALKALVGGIATSVNVQGYYTVDDGGEGIFNWNGSSSATDDAGIIIAPTSGSGRWIRQTYPGKPNVAWWGAKCDWSGAKTDNTPMIQAAVNWLQSSSAGGSVTAPRGCNMAIHDTVVVNGSSIVIEGAAPAADALGSNWQSAWNIHWANTGTGIMFAFTPSGSGVVKPSGNGLRNIFLQGEGYAFNGLQVVSQNNGSWMNLSFAGMTGTDIWVTVWPYISSGGSLTDNCDSQYNVFDTISANQYNTGASVLSLDGYSNSSFTNSGCNPSFNIFRNFHMGVNAAPWLYDWGGDNNFFENTSAYMQAGGASNPSAQFLYNTAGPGPIYWTNTEVLARYSSNASPRINGSATAIRFNDLDSGNGTPAPYCNGGSAHANWNYVNGTSGSC